MSLPPQTPLFEAMLADYPDIDLPDETMQGLHDDRARQISPEFAERTLSQLARAGWEVLDLREADRVAATEAAKRIGPGSKGSLVIIIPDVWLTGSVPHSDLLRRIAAEHQVPVFALPKGGLL